MSKLNTRSEAITDALNTLLDLIADDVADRVMQRLEKTTSKVPKEPILVTVPEAAKMLNVSIPTLYRLMDAGEVEFVKYGRARRIVYASLHAMIQNRSKQHQ